MQKCINPQKQPITLPNNQRTVGTTVLSVRPGLNQFLLSVRAPTLPLTPLLTLTLALSLTLPLALALVLTLSLTLILT